MNGHSVSRRSKDARLHAQVVLRGEDRAEVEGQARDLEGGELGLRVQHYGRQRWRVDGGSGEGARVRAGGLDRYSEMYGDLRVGRLHEHRLREDEPPDGVHE